MVGMLVGGFAFSAMISSIATVFESRDLSKQAANRWVQLVRVFNRQPKIKHCNLWSFQATPPTTNACVQANWPRVSVCSWPHHGESAPHASAEFLPQATSCGVWWERILAPNAVPGRDRWRGVLKLLPCIH
jgi:hypothetical protein